MTYKQAESLKATKTKVSHAFARTQHLNQNSWWQFLNGERYTDDKSNRTSRCMLRMFATIGSYAHIRESMSAEELAENVIHMFDRIMWMKKNLAFHWSMHGDNDKLWWNHRIMYMQQSHRNQRTWLIQISMISKKTEMGTAYTYTNV